MGAMTMASSGLLPKINSLFNNPLYSDIQFIFINEDGSDDRIYCHKLILALQSKAFADEFFMQGTSPSVMKMKAAKKDLFLTLFKFLYTGDVQFRTFGEAQNLYELANDLRVEELVEKCHNYMLQGHLTFANVFSRYECALKKQLNGLLKDCQSFISSNVQIILESDDFVNASPEVIEDIVKLDNLALSSELEIIKAVLKWGSKSLSRNEVPYNETNLRKSIDPFLKHLRISTLTIAEFEYLVEHHNIFTTYETMVLTRNIMTSDPVRLPENFCCTSSKRCAAVVSNVTEPKYQQSQTHQISIKSKSVCSDPPRSRNFDNNRIGYQVRKYSQKNNNASGFKQKFISSPNIVRDIEFPAPNFSQSQREFLFPLMKSEKSFTLSFRKDIKSWINMKMKNGNISLYGFELKVKNKNEKKEELEFSVDLKGFSKQRFEKSYKMELQNDVLSVKFPKPMTLLEGNKGTMEVNIEDLFLDRCNQTIKKPYELNSGLNFECEFCIDSNKKTDDGDGQILFLISKLIYVPY